MQPVGILPGRALKLKAPDPEGDHAQFGEASVRLVEPCDVEEAEVSSKGLVTTDAFVVVEQVPAAVQDKLAAVDLQADGMVAGVTVDDVHPGNIDQEVGEFAMRLGDMVAPVASPVQRGDHEVARLLYPFDFAGDMVDCAIGQVGQMVHAGVHRPRRPAGRHATALRAPGEDQHAPATCEGQDGRGGGLPRIVSGACRFQSGPMQAGEGLLQSRRSPVEHVVVGQHAAVDPCGRQARQVGGVHAVVDALRLPILGGGDGGLEVDDAEVGADPFELGEGIAPDVFRWRRAGQGTAHPLG